MKYQIGDKFRGNLSKKVCKIIKINKKFKRYRLEYEDGTIEGYKESEMSVCHTYLPNVAADITDLKIGPFADLDELQAVWQRVRDLGHKTYVTNFQVYKQKYKDKCLYLDTKGFQFDINDKDLFLTGIDKPNISPAEFLTTYPTPASDATALPESPPAPLSPPIWDSFTESMRGVCIVTRDREAQLAAATAEAELITTVKNAKENI